MAVELTTVRWFELESRPTASTPAFHERAADVSGVVDARARTDALPGHVDMSGGVHGNVRADLLGDPLGANEEREELLAKMTWRARPTPQPFPVSPSRSVNPLFVTGD